MTLHEKNKRETLKANLKFCTKFQKDFFKKMYGQYETVEECVDNMSAKKLNKALDQVDRTIIKNVMKI